MPYLMKQQHHQRPMGNAPGGHRGYQGGKPGGPGGMRPGGNRSYQGGNPMQQRGAPMHGGPQMNGSQPPMGGQNNMQMNPAAAQMNQQQQMMQQQQIVQQQQQMQQMTIEQRYLMTCNAIIHAMVPENPNYKEQVGTTLYEYIAQLVGTTKAPKVTGMLIDLPIEDIKLIMQDFSLLQTRVQQASEMLEQQSTE